MARSRVNDNCKGARETKTMTVNQTLAASLKAIGVQYVFGVTGIPIVDLGEALQAVGIYYYGFRNEQAAAFAAVGFGWISRTPLFVPPVLLTTGGPGFLNALAGIAHAGINRAPVVVLGGSAPLQERGLQAFQELDQVHCCQPLINQGLCLGAFQIRNWASIPEILSKAFCKAMQYPPGCVYVDLPRDILYTEITNDESEAIVSRCTDHFAHIISENETSPSSDWNWEECFHLIEKAQAPLIVAGEAIAHEHAERDLVALSEYLSVAVLPTSMAKGCIPSSHPLCVSAARSKALKEADLVIVIGTQINWMLHFGVPPHFNDKVVFIHLDYPVARMNLKTKARVAFKQLGSVAMLLKSLVKGVKAQNVQLQETAQAWTKLLMEANKFKLESIQSKQIHCIQFIDEHTTKNPSYADIMAVIDHHLRLYKKTHAPHDIVVVSEGALTMDKSRQLIQISNPRGRLDAGAWGTMGCGLGYALASHLHHARHNTPHLIVAIEGDSAIGFSLAELETLARYSIPVLVIVMNNGGIYSGKSVETNTSGLPSATKLSYQTRYEMVAQGLGGLGECVESAYELHVKNTRHSLLCLSQICLEKVLKIGLTSPYLINVNVDPEEGATSTFLH